MQDLLTPDYFNWLFPRPTDDSFDQYKLPALNSSEFAQLKQSLAGKIARTALPPKPEPASAEMTTTTNGAATFASSGSARTDFFFKVKQSGLYRGTSAEDTTTPLLQQVMGQLML